MSCIDLHAHYFPAEYLDALDEFGSQATRRSVVTARPGDDPADLAARFDDDGRRRSRRAGRLGGRGASVLRGRGGRGRGRSAGQRPATPKPSAGIVRACSPSRSRPLPHVEASIEEARRALDDLGMVGVAVASSVLGRSLADPAFEPFYAELDRRGATLAGASRRATARDRASIREHDLTWMLGAPVEDTLGVLHLIRSGIASRYRRISYVACHLGGALPLLLPQTRQDRSLGSAGHARDAESSRPGASGTRRRRTVTVRPCGRRSTRSAPADWCSAATIPYQRGEWYSRAVSYVRDASLDAQDEEAILGASAARLVGLSMGQA